MSLIGDIRLSCRTLAQNPGFTAVAVLMLAVGIGVNATVFTVTDAVLFRGFPKIHGNDRLVYISNGGCCVSYPDFEDYRSQAKSFEDMGIVHGISMALGDTSGYPEHVEVTEVSANTFALVGARPVMGRDFVPADQMEGASKVAILNYSFWERRYGKDASLVGKTIRLNGNPTTVVGVMPEGFTFPQTVDLWVPLVITEEVRKRENRATWFAFGPLANGATFEAARAEIEGIGKRLAAEYPLSNHDYKPVVSHFHEFFIGANALAIHESMWGAVSFVLLIACANLANLLLSRAAGRSREISVRIALGAGRWRIIRQLLIESLVLSGTGGFLGWWLARWGVQTYQAAMTAKSSWLILDYTMDRRVLLYLIAISVGTGILFGLAPALRLSRLDVNTALKDGGRGATGGENSRKLSGLLVAGEMALAVVLLAGAGVMIRSFLKVHSANLGVNANNLVVGSLDLPGRYPTPEARIAFFDRLTAQLRTTPGVESVALAETLPSWGGKRPVEVEGSAPVDVLLRPKHPVLSVGTPYFQTMQAALLSGREFRDSDNASSAPVALVNEKFASQHWPGTDPIGKRLRLFQKSTPQQWLTVVGVVANIIQADDTRQTFNPVVYVPYRQSPGAGMWVVVRTRVSPESMKEPFRRIVAAMDSELPMYGPMIMSERLERYWDSRFYGGMFLIFAAIALLLASVGLYAVIAHSVSQRTQELGIRMAIGAGSRDILTLVFQQGMAPLGAGLALGLIASVAVNRVLEAMLVHVSPSDPLTLAVSSGVLIFSAMLGCSIPAIRAMRVDPVVALRHE